MTSGFVRLYATPHQRSHEAGVDPIHQGSRNHGDDFPTRGGAPSCPPSSALGTRVARRDGVVWRVLLRRNLSSRCAGLRVGLQWRELGFPPPVVVGAIGHGGDGRGRTLEVSRLFRHGLTLHLPRHPAARIPATERVRTGQEKPSPPRVPNNEASASGSVPRRDEIGCSPFGQ